MVIPIDIAETKEYVLKVDRGNPAENQTIFILGVVDVLTRAKIEDLYLRWSYNQKGGDDDQATAKFSQNDLNLDIVRFGLKGWKNFLLKDGSDVPFTMVSKGIQGLHPRQVIDDKGLRYLAAEWVAELADAIRKFNSIDDDTRKNSDAPSPKP
jgi:hypothetical protein